MDPKTESELVCFSFPFFPVNIPSTYEHREEEEERDGERAREGESGGISLSSASS